MHARGEVPPLGVPIDRRSEKQRRGAGASTNADFELMAARVIARHLGERVELVDDGSTDSRVDIYIRYLDDTLGAVEVVTDTSKQWAATYNEIRKREFKVPSPSLARRWYLYLRRDCTLSRLEQDGPHLLVELEATGPPLGE